MSRKCPALRELMWAKYQGVRATPATAPALHCQNGNNMWAKLFFFIILAKLQGPPSYHRKQRSLLEFVVEGERKRLHSFSRSSDESTRRANRHFIRACHQGSGQNLHNRDNGAKSEDWWPYTSKTDTSGDLLTSYTARSPWYVSLPSLNDTARRSPEASHANFSMHRLERVKRIN
jgi:hypothetical protein